MNDRNYFETRLSNRGETARAEATEIVAKMREILARAGTLNSDQAGIEINQSLTSHYRNVLAEMSRFIFQSFDGDPTEAGEYLEKAASSLSQAICGDLTEIYDRASAYRSVAARRRYLDALASQLNVEKCNAVGDFAHGVAGDEKMKRPTIDASNNTAGNGLPWDRIASGMAATAVVILVIFVVVRNERFADPNIVVLMRIILGLAVAVLGATVPGFLNISWKGSGLLIRAGGALALFVLSLFWTPRVEGRELLIDGRPNQSEVVDSVHSSVNCTREQKSY